MITYILSHWKFVPLLGALWLAAALAAVESSTAPWVFGALVPIGVAILGALLAILKALWAIQGRMSVVETQVSPLWISFQQQVAKTLHNPELRDKEADELIRDLEYLRMTPEKITRLRVLMVTREKDPTRGEQERKRAKLLLFLMDMVAEEEKEKEKVGTEF
jgi:hypothetical protein